MSERQYGKYLSDIRSDHLERYEHAAELVSGNVLDAACGVGYGSYLMCLRRKSIKVLGVDINKGALEFANMTWKHERNKFARCDLHKMNQEKQFNWLVSFETIEHLKYPSVFLREAAGICKNIVCSVPNQKAIPFTKERFPHHYRHYTSEEIIDLLHKSGFSVTKVQYQRTAYAEGFNAKHGRSIVIEGMSNETRN